MSIVSWCAKDLWSGSCGALQQNVDHVFWQSEKLGTCLEIHSSLAQSEQNFPTQMKFMFALLALVRPRLGLSKHTRFLDKTPHYVLIICI
jgi:hypothetical protein